MNRDKQIIIRVTKIEKKIIERKAEESGMEVSPFLRHRALEKEGDIVLRMLKPFVNKKTFEKMQKKVEETWG